MTENYWHHNISPFIFEVKNIPFGWVSTWWGIVLLLALAGGGYWLTGRIGRDKPDLGAGLRFALGFGLFLLALMFGLQKGHVDWGLRWYSTMYLISFVFVFSMCRRWINRRMIMLTPLLLDSLIVYLFTGMVLGARLVYVTVYNWDVTKADPASIIKVWEGGLSFHGGVIGVVTAIYLFTRKNSIPFYHLADKLSFCVPFGIGIGRIGNFMNGELYGRVIESHIPWAVVFPDGGPNPRHPSQIYQSICEGWLLALTLVLISRRKHREGTIAIAFIFFYGLYRFPMEFFREADAQLKYYFNNSLTMGQILSLLIMTVGATLFFTTRGEVVEGSPQWRQRIDAFLASRKKIEEGENGTAAPAAR